MPKTALIKMSMVDKAGFSAAASVNGVEREPWAMQTCLTPWRVSASRMTAAQRRLNALTDMRLSGINIATQYKESNKWIFDMSR